MEAVVETAAQYDGRMTDKEFEERFLESIKQVIGKEIKEAVYNKDYAHLTKPLTPTEVLTLIENGWEFLNDEYIYIPDDDDGCMAYGIRCIRRILNHINNKEKSKCTD